MPIIKAPNAKIPIRPRKEPAPEPYNKALNLKLYTQPLGAEGRRRPRVIRSGFGFWDKAANRAWDSNSLHRFWGDEGWGV